VKQSLHHALNFPNRSISFSRQRLNASFIKQLGMRWLGKNLWAKTISLLLCFALAGCSTDQQRTKTQGTAFGALVGAIAGAGVGALSGALTGNSDNIVRGAIAGAVVGGTAGGVAGYQWGERVAFNKGRYIKSEDRLQGNIQQASKVRVAAAQENNKLRGQITKLNDQLSQLSADAAAGKDDKQLRATLANSVDQRRHDVARKIEAAGNEIEDRTQGLRENINGNPQRVEQLKGQISSLSKERAQMQDNNRKLESISSRISA
jgi:uncharacterized membrane protein